MAKMSTLLPCRCLSPPSSCLSCSGDCQPRLPPTNTSQSMALQSCLLQLEHISGAWPGNSRCHWRPNTAVVWLSCDGPSAELNLPDCYLQSRLLQKHYAVCGRGLPSIVSAPCREGQASSSWLSCSAPASPGSQLYCQVPKSFTSKVLKHRDNQSTRTVVADATVICLQGINHCQPRLLAASSSIS